MRLAMLLVLTGTLSLMADQPAFFPSGAKPEMVWAQGTFTEGPCPGPDGCIYFSDIGDRILKFDPETKKTTVFRDPSWRSNGLKFDAAGRLIACEGANTGGNRRISITAKDGAVKTLADGYAGRRFNSPNDLCLDTKGRVYFTDPRYIGNEPRELDVEGVYRVDLDGAVTQIIWDVQKPNGIVLSPRQDTLYLADNNNDPRGRRVLLAYPFKKDGTVGLATKLHDFGADRGIDGMTVDADGHIVVTAGRGETAGITVFGPDGKKFAFLATPEDPSNCCFGGTDLKTLFITAGKSLYRVETGMTGVRPPWKK